MREIANEETKPPLSPEKARLYSHGVRFGYLEGGPRDAETFLRNWNGDSLKTDAGLYRINRSRVEHKGSGYCVVFEFAGE